jgi:hypothetical protein
VLRLGLDREGLGELIAVVDLFNGLNRVADAYQIEPDVKPMAEEPAHQPRTHMH